MMEVLATISAKEEETMDKITTIGLDLAKQVFHVVGLRSLRLPLPCSAAVVARMKRSVIRGKPRATEPTESTDES